MYNRKYFGLAVVLLLPTVSFFPVVNLRATLPVALLAQGGGTTADLLQQGEALFQTGDFNAALKQFQQAVKTAERSGEPLQQVDALNALGKTYGAMGRFQEATTPFEAAQAIAAKQKDRSGARQRGDLEGQAKALNGLGSALESLGQYQASEDWYEKLKKLAQDRGDRKWLAVALSGLGRVARSTGQTEQTIQYYEQVLDYTRQLQDRAGEAATHQALGFAYRLAGKVSQSTAAYQQALEISQSLQNQRGMAEALVGLGGNDSAQQQYAQALPRYQRALELWQQLGDRPAQAETLTELGKTYTANGQPTQAIPLQQQSLALAQELKNPQLETNALTHLGAAQMSAEQYSAATTTLQGAIKLLESLRAGLTDANRVSIFERQKIAYSYLQQALIAQKQVEAALEIAERGRARAFVELLARGLSSSSSARNTPTVAAPTIAQIKQVAREQKATLVEYSALENQQIFIWVVSPEGQVSFRQSSLQPLGKTLEALVDNSRAAIGVRGRVAFKEQVTLRTDENQTRSANESLRQWHQLLIQPIRDLLPQDPLAQIVFIPQNSLFFVPFAALQDETDKFLIEKHTVRTAPAIQVLALTRQQRQGLSGASDRQILLVGNPDMPSVRPPSGGLAVKLASLPGAEAEAKAISSLLKVEALLGKQATKARVLQQMPKSRLVHLATHGLLDFEDAGIPGAIALTPDSQDSDRVKRGLLTASEISQLKLKAELVVLSACDTGRGKITGDGVIGLSRSLISAGTPSVIVSLWAVPDAPTAALMVSFYKNLQRTPDKAQALRQAMLETLKSYPDPRSWAAFVLIGEA